MTVRGRLSKPIAITLAVMALTAALSCALNITGLTRPPPLSETTAMIRALAAPAFLAAGVLRFARWRITGERDCGLRAAAMLLMGGISLPSAALARALSAPAEGLATVTCVRALTVGAILYVLAVALSGDTAAREQLARKVGWLTLTTAAVTVLVLIERDRLAPEPSMQLVLTRGVAAALALAWLIVAAGALAKAHQLQWAGPAAPLLAAMGVAELFRLPDRPVTTLVAAGLTAAVGFLVAGSALVDLVRAAQEAHSASQDLTRELAATRGAVWDRDAWHEELTHDARSRLAGIRAAMLTLDRHKGELDAETADRLRVATFAELTHLEQMLVRRSADVACFDVGEVVLAVTDVRRAAGLVVDVTVCSTLARGVSTDLATVLQNLLVNAQEHAPGARVRVDVRTDGERVHVTVSDDGPGMPAASAHSPFDRGERGPDSGGSGLGLSIARGLMRRNDGELELRKGSHGTTFVASLPVAEPTGSAPVTSPVGPPLTPPFTDPVGVAS